jgi:hypothetical protein
VIKLKLPQLETRLRQVSRCQPVGFTAIVTPSRVRKTNNPLAGKIRKVSIGRGMINCHYDDAVNRNRIREGLPADFVSGPPSVGVRVDGCPLLEHVCDGSGESRFYLEIYVQEIRSHYFCTDDNRELNYFDDVKPFEYQRPTGGSGFRDSQGTRKVVRPLPYRLQSLAELRINQETWTVVPTISELHRYLKPANGRQPAVDESHHNNELVSSK